MNIPWMSIPIWVFVVLLVFATLAVIDMVIAYRITRDEKER